MAPVSSSSPFASKFIQSTNNMENVFNYRKTQNNNDNTALTFVHKGVQNVSKFFEGGVNIVTAPIKFIQHVQENW